MDIIVRIKNYFSKSMIRQVILLHIIALILLLLTLFLANFFHSRDLPSWVQNEKETLITVDYWVKTFREIRHLPFEDLSNITENGSMCHAGYKLTKQPMDYSHIDEDAQKLSVFISNYLGLPESDVSVGFVMLKKDDFSYFKCAEGDIQLPVPGMLIGIKIDDQLWLNREVHPHEWHLTEEMTGWLTTHGTLFLLLSIITS